MSLAIRALKEGDLETLAQASRAVDRVQLEPFKELIDEGLGVFVVADKESSMPLAVWGCAAPDLLGDAHVWAVFTDAARGHAISVFKAARTLLDYGIAARGILRYYTWNFDDAPENDKWMRALGFQRLEYLDGSDGENTLRGYVYGKQEA